MTTFSTNIPSLSAPSEAIWTRFVRLANGMVQNSDRAKCARRAARLYAMSDAELAQIGLKRTEIAERVFGRYLHQ